MELTFFIVFHVLGAGFALWTLWEFLQAFTKIVGYRRNIPRNRQRSLPVVVFDKAEKRRYRKLARPLERKVAKPPDDPNQAVVEPGSSGAISGNIGSFTDGFGGWFRFRPTHISALGVLRPSVPEAGDRSVHGRRLQWS